MQKFILVMYHYQDLDSAPDWMYNVASLLQPIRSTSSIWVVGSSAVPDPDLEIKGGGSSRPLHNRGGWSPKKIFWPFGPQFGLKIRGKGRSPGSATDQYGISAVIPQTSSCRETSGGIVTK